MATMSYEPAAMRAYLAGRQRAHLMSVDASTVDIPADHQAQSDAYREGVLDEQANAPLPTQSSSPPKAAPPPPAQPGRVASAEAEARWKRNREQKEFLSRLKLQPVDTIRAVAEAQILRVEATFQKDAPYYSRTLQLDYAAIKDRLANARANLEAGDKLRNKADEASKMERRNSYLRAYNVAFGEADSLDKLIGGESFVITALGQVVIPAATQAAEAVADAGKAALQAGKNLAGEVGSTARNITYIAAGGAVLALLVFASQAGKRR